MSGDAQALFSRHVVSPAGMGPATVAIADGRIASVEAGGAPARGARDLGDLWLLPGGVDTHVHVNEPGRTEWEGFESATRAALAGGVTTIVDMPLNSVPATTTRRALTAKREAAAGSLAVDVALWGGVVPGNVGELERLAASGVRGFKCFLVPSGVDEFPAVGESDLRAALPLIARLGLPLLVHAEWPEIVDRATAEALRRRADPRHHATWLSTRPAESEVEAVRFLALMAEEYRCHLHVVHVASAGVLPVLREARARGLPVSAETCPHYLTFDAAAVPDGGTAFKCAPPIRARADREALWEGLRAGDLDLVASDHSPCPPRLKAAEGGDFLAAWGGIASLELTLPAVWSGARERGFTPVDLVRWLAERPAALAGLWGRKGAIAPGADADLVAWDPDARWTVEEARLHQRHKLTPYSGAALHGRVRSTWVRGSEAFADGEVVQGGSGRLLLEPRERRA